MEVEKEIVGHSFKEHWLEVIIEVSKTCCKEICWLQILKYLFSFTIERIDSAVPAHTLSMIMNGHIHG